MDTSQVEQDLNLRIEQSREWVDERVRQPSRISAFEITRWTAIAREFLDDKGRVERHGVKFDFVLDDPAKTLKVQLCIRIKPELTEGEKGRLTAVCCSLCCQPGNKSRGLRRVP